MTFLILVARVGQNDVRMKGALGQRNPHFSSPEGVARHSKATLPNIFVAQEYGTTRLGDTSEHFRRPRVQYDTFRRHFRPFLLPMGVGQNDVRMNGTLRQRNPHYSSPESAARHFQATLPRLFVAQRCRTVLFGNKIHTFRRLGGWATSTLCRRGWSCRRGSTGERGLRSGHPRSACDGPLRCAQGRTFGGRG